MFHNGERGFIDFRADQRRPPGPQRNDAFSRESESPAKPVVPSSLSEAMKRAEMMAARIETRYERSRSQARRERRSRSRSRSRPRSPVHRGGYRLREKSRGRSRSRRGSPRSRSPPDGRNSYRHRSKSSNRHPRSESAGRHATERGRSPGSFRRNGRVSRFDQPDLHRGRSRIRSGRSPLNRRTPPNLSPLKVGRSSPGDQAPRDPFSAGALSRFEAPPSPKRDSLSPTALGGDPKQPSKKNLDPKSQVPPAEDLYEGISNDSMSQETSRKFLNATFRPIEPAHHSKENAHSRRPLLDSPVNSIFPEVAPMEQLLSNPTGPGRSGQGRSSQQRDLMDRLDRTDLSASDARARRADGPDGEAGVLSGGRDESHRLTMAEERYLEIVKLRENIRRAEQSIAAEASKRPLRSDFPPDRDAFPGGRGDQARLERRDSERAWEPLGPGGAADHPRRLSPPYSSFGADRMPEGKDQWRSLEDNNLPPSRQPGPPSVRSNMSGTGYGRLTPPLADGGRGPFSSSASGLPNHDGHRDQPIRILGLSALEDEEYLYLLTQQHRLSPVKRLPLAASILNDGNSQATSGSLPSVRSDGPGRGGPGGPAGDREDWLREIDDLKRQLREKEDLAKEFRNRPPMIRDQHHPNRPLSPRPNQDFDGAPFRPTEHGGIRRETDQRLQGRRPCLLMRPSPSGRLSPGARSPHRRTRSPSARSKRSHTPTYRRRSRSPYSRRSPITRKSPLDDRTMDRDAYVRAMDGYNPPRHGGGSSVRSTNLAGGFHGSAYIAGNVPPPAVPQTVSGYGGASITPLAGGNYYGQVQPTQSHPYYAYGDSFATDPRDGYPTCPGTHGSMDHLSHTGGSAQVIGASISLSDSNKMLERGPEMTNLRTLTSTSHGKKGKRKGKDTPGEGLTNDSRSNPPAFAEVDVGLQPIDMDLEEEDEVVGGIALQAKEQPPPVSSRPEEKYAQEIESYLKLTNEKDAEKERLSVLKQEMSRISKLQADLLRIRKAAPDDAHVGRQLANTGKLYEEAKKKANGVGKQIDALGQDIFKIPQKIKLLAMEHEHKFRDKIEAIKKATKEKNKVAISISGQKRKDVRFKYVDRGEFFCSYCRTEFRSVASFLAHLHTELHIANSNQAQEKPWANLETTTKISVPAATTCNVPAKGGQFIMGITGFYCKICKGIFPDSPTAEKHVLSEEHNLKYKEYIGINPFYERRVQLEKETILHSIAKATAPRQGSSLTAGGGSGASGKSRSSSAAESDDRKLFPTAPGNSKRSPDHSSARSSRESRDIFKAYRTGAAKADSSNRFASGGSRATARNKEQSPSSPARHRQRTSSKDSDRDMSLEPLDQISELSKKTNCNSNKETSRSPSPRITSTTENSQKSGGIRLKLLKPSCGSAQPLMIGKAPFKRKPPVNITKDEVKGSTGEPCGPSAECEAFSIGAPPAPPGDDEPMLPVAMGPLKAPEPVEEGEPPPPGETEPPPETLGWIPSAYSPWDHPAPVPLVPEIEEEDPDEDELEEY